MRPQQQGFTLIELVIVIVILGILSAFALPRFADLSGDAETAAVEGARGSVNSAASIVRSKALASGNGDESSTDAITIEGTGIDLQNGYLAATSLEDAAQLTDFTVELKNSDADADVTIESPSTDSPCFTFTGSTGADTPPEISTVSNDWTTGTPGSCSP